MRGKPVGLQTEAPVAGEFEPGGVEGRVEEPIGRQAELENRGIFSRVGMEAEVPAQGGLLRNEPAPRGDERGGAVKEAGDLSGRRRVASSGHIVDLGPRKMQSGGHLFRELAKEAVGAEFERRGGLEEDGLVGEIQACSARC